MQSVGLKSCPGCLHRQLQASQPLRLQQRRPIAQRSQPRLISAESTRGTATLPVRDTQGEDVGSVELSLKVAGGDTAKGLVHRYLVMARQNARSVSRCIRGSIILEPASCTRAARCACAGTYCQVPGQTLLNPEPGVDSCPVQPQSCSPGCWLLATADWNTNVDHHNAGIVVNM